MPSIKTAMPDRPPAMTTHARRDTSGNVRAIAAMLAATAFFIVVDVMMKLVSTPAPGMTPLPVGESIVLRNTLATALILAYAWISGGLNLPKDPPWNLLGWRMVGEGGSTITYLSALAMMPIADASGIAQFSPLAIAAAAALRGENVGWRRWAATLAGFVGVMMIIRPGTSAFAAPGLLVLAAISLNILRDFATRGITVAISTVTLTLMSSVATLASGLIMWPFETWIWPSATDMWRLAVAAVFLLGGYASMIITMRNGDVSAATPFRYSGIVAAILAGWLVWNEMPDTLSLAGIAIVCAAGYYTLRREQSRAR